MASPVKGGSSMDARTLAYESLVGLSVGDALGGPFQGHPFDLARMTYEPATDHPSMWTDDTQMALSIVEVLTSTGTIDQDELALCFGRRYKSRRGYGLSMLHLLPRLRRGEDWRQLREMTFPDGSFGNGSAMRVAPLGAYFSGQAIDRVAREATWSAEVTHSHPEALAGAIAVAVAAWLAARHRGQSARPAEELIAETLAALDQDLEVSRGLAAAAELAPTAHLDEAVRLLGNGSRVSCQDTVPLAVWIASLHLDNFEAAVRLALGAGGDTDTVAAIVGGIVAAHVGVEGIPARWLQAVEPLPIGRQDGDKPE
jgi:ADP-ribosylglycohydrolase